MNFGETLASVFSRLKTWVFFADVEDVILASVFVVVIFLARKPLSRLIVKSLNNLMTHLAVSMPDEAKNELESKTSILLVVGALFIAADVLQFPVLAGGLINKLLASVALIAVFSGWYNLCGPFVSLLGGYNRLEINVESSWMKRAARFGVILFGISALLTVWKVDISGAMTGVGVLGAGVAIAAQDLVRNLVAGMNNQSEKRFTEGDVVEIEGNFIGVVEQIDLRSTVLRGFDQIPRYIPNSDLSNAVVLNYSQLRTRRVKKIISLVLSCTDQQLKGFKQDLRDYMLNSGDYDLSDGAPQYVNIVGLSENAIEVLFYARTKTADYQNFLDVDERLTLKILEISRRHDTAIAYPTQTIDMKSPLGSDRPDA